MGHSTRRKFKNLKDVRFGPVIDNMIFDALLTNFPKVEAIIVEISKALKETCYIREKLTDEAYKRLKKHQVSK